MVRSIAGDVMNGGVPGIEDAIAMKRDALPAGKGASNFDCGWSFGLAIGKPPAKDFSEALLLLSVLSPLDLRGGRFAHWRKALLRRLAIKQIAEGGKHNSGFRARL